MIKLIDLKTGVAVLHIKNKSVVLQKQERIYKLLKSIL